MADTTGWLIERRSRVGGATQYLTCYGRYPEDPTQAEAKLGWGEDPNAALRFARHTDACMFLGTMRNLMAGLPYRETVRGLRRDDESPAVAEHRWMDGPPEQQEET